jgi:predicted component of type VI protein secretion system
MVDHAVEKIVDKLQKLRALRHARERVRQLERELNGEPARPESTPHLPEFLRQRGPLRVAK